MYVKIYNADGSCSERPLSTKELDVIKNAENEPIPPMPPSLEEKVANLEKDNETLTQCVLEMSTLLYQ